MGKESAISPASPNREECAAMGAACACHNLRRAARAVTQIFDACLDEVGLKATQFTVLAVLSYRGDDPFTVSELAEALVLEQSSLSRNLAVLERLGYVRLVRGDDRRQRNVRLTRRGRAALVRAYPVWKRAQASIAGAMPGDELDASLRSLRRMTSRALALKAPPPAGRARTVNARAKPADRARFRPESA